MVAAQRHLVQRDKTMVRAPRMLVQPRRFDLEHGCFDYRTGRANASLGGAWALGERPAGGTTNGSRAHRGATEAGIGSGGNATGGKSSVVTGARVASLSRLAASARIDPN
jgi:hypothetical protein